MLGYLLGVGPGALSYNLAHLYAGPLLLGVMAVLGGWEGGVLLALIWTAHIGMDHVVGYGLKYSTGLKDSHLGHV